MGFETVNYIDRFDLEIFEGVLTSHSYPWHYHNSYTISIVEKGSMKYVYRDKEFIVKSNQIHVVNPFISHCNFPIAKCEYKAIFLPLCNFTLSEKCHSILHFEEMGI